MVLANCPSWCLILLISILNYTKAADDDYNVLHRDGSYEFGYNTPDSYHYADANRRNIVRGEFGGRNPTTGAIDSTVYTAGPRGFRPRGKNVVRKYDLNQNGPRPIGSRDDPYYDPFEDPSYSFAFKTRTYNRQENANRVGDVTGRYNFVDDVGERHNVEYIAGKNTGFHVKTPFPDSNPRAYGPLYFTGRGRPIPRGRTSIQRGLDGSYRFVSAGPDQRRTETSDSTGHVRGSYTYLDDKGVQHSVHYIAGPETGYRVLKNVKGPHFPTVFPFGRPEIIPPDFYDYAEKEGDLFDTAASGHVKPINNNNIGGGGGGTTTTGTGGSKDKDNFPGFENGVDLNNEDFDKLNNDLGRPGGGSGTKPFVRPPGASAGGGGGRPFNKPSYEEDGGDSVDFSDFFGGGDGGASSTKPSFPSGAGKPTGSSAEDDGSYKPTGEDGTYKPSSTFAPTPGSSTTSRPSGADLGTTYRPLVRPGGRPGRPGRPGLPPTGIASGFLGDDDGSSDDGDSFGLFGSETGSRPPPSVTTGSRPGTTTGGRPVIQIGPSGDGPSSECPKCSGTIVTNVGDRLFTVPPGVSVRAHVQSIDLLPVSSNIPSPSEQYKIETTIKTEQLNGARNKIVSTKSSRAKETDTTTEDISTTTIDQSTTPESES